MDYCFNSRCKNPKPGNHESHSLQLSEDEEQNNLDVALNQQPSEDQD
jgi:hypothetical protein